MLDTIALSATRGHDLESTSARDLDNAANVTDPLQRLLIRILEELTAAGADYALIHGDANAWPEVGSDVDIAFAEPPPRALEPILQRLADSEQLVFVQRLHYEVAHGYYYVLSVPGVGDRFLHLDCLHDPSGLNRYRLPTSRLLDAAQAGTYGRHTEPKTRALYLLMKRAVKGKITATDLATLRQAVLGAPEGFWRDVEHWFGSGAQREVEQLLQSNDSERATAHLRTLAEMADAAFVRQHPLRACRRLIQDTVRKLRRFVQPTGLFVVLVGPDGSGKSTVARLVLSRLERAFRRTWHFHWRPGLLPKPGSDNAATTDTKPAEVSKYGGVVSLIRFAYYLVDFVLGYWFVIYRRKAQTTLVLGERYFPDMLVHPERYGFKLPRWLLRAAAKLVPAPDLLIVLRGDADAIFARKPELPVATIARQTRAYEIEATHWRRYRVVNATQSAEEVAANVAELILSECSRRTQRRLKAAGQLEYWRAFPSARSVKVWFNDRDSLANALHLYHPYSLFGRLATFLGRGLPRRLYGFCFPDRATADLATRFRRLSDAVRSTLGDETLTVSFYAGTPGPHQKFTAQVSSGGEIVSYVKIGSGAAVGSLLQHEAEFLRWLARHQFKAAELPRVLALTHCADDTMLFVSPPPEGPGRRRQQPLGYDDLRFLLALADLERGVLPVEEMLSSMGVDAYSECIRDVDAGAAATLRETVEVVREGLRASGVVVSPSHGDYAPWNTIEVSDGRMFVFDWEYARYRGPALHDMFQRIFSPLRLVTYESAAASIDRIFEVIGQPLFGKLVAQARIEPSQVPLYLLMYLLEQICLRPNDVVTPDPFLVEALHYTLELTRSAPRRRKVLISAYACEPNSGSEPGVGWQMCQAISKEHEVWVITRENNRQSIEAAQALQPNPRLHFAYADLPPWARFWKRGERGVHLYYYLWQFAALRVAHRLAKHIKFDLAHHVTFVNDYTFSFLSLLNIPFVWGPIGSNNRGSAPLMQDAKAVAKERLRYYVKAVQRVADPLVWLSASRARLVIGNNPSVLTRLPFSLWARSKGLTHIAIGVEETITASAPSVHSGFRVISVGNLIPIKGFHLTIRAFAKLAQTQPSARLTVVGQGPMRAELVALARELGVSERVEFLAWLPRPEALALMREADVFLFPSYEVAGMVVLEALAHALPVVALQGTGPGSMITEECGYAVEQGTIDDTVARLADCLAELATDAARCERMGMAGQRVVRERYVWERRHEAVRVWYTAAGLYAGTTPALA